MTDTSTPAWHPDPYRRHELRYWDGARWSEHVSDAGVRSVDPLAAAPAPGASASWSAAVTPTSTDLLGKRAGAFAIDYIAVIVINMFVGFVIGLVVGVVMRGSGMAADQIAGIGSLTATVVALPVPLLYFAIPEWKWGATPGKALLGLRVVREDGGPIGFGQALGRNVALVVDMILFGLVAFLAMRSSALHQRFGDQWAKTAVIAR